MSDSPPSKARAMQSKPTMSESSAWKNCLVYISGLVRISKILKHGLPCICSVYTDFINSFWIITNILDVPEDMASTILADEITQIGS
jgi:hypothetical protein